MKNPNMSYLLGSELRSRPDGTHTTGVEIVLLPSIVSYNELARQIPKLVARGARCRVMWKGVRDLRLVGKQSIKTA